MVRNSVTVAPGGAAPRLRRGRNPAWRCTPLLADVDAGRHPLAAATVAQLVERYLEVVDVEVAIRAGDESLIRRTSLPLLGEVLVGRVRGEVLGSPGL